MRNRLLLLPFSILIALSVLGLAACGDDDDDGGNGLDNSDASPVDIDISQVPELSDGVLTVGSDIAYPPIEFYEEGTQNAMGLDVDLMTAMGVAMGVEVEFEQVADFAGIVGDLNASRYDAVMSAISITEEREAEIDLIPYFGPAGTGILVQAGNPEGIDSVEDLCGLAVAAQVGTIQVDQMNGFNEDICADNPIDVRTFPDNPAAVQELILGRVQAELADDPVAAYSVQQNEEELVEVVVQGFDSLPYGIGLRKESTALKTALEQALQSIRDDGQYNDILEKWGLEGLGYEE
jgi:polar amino acid transport system substrate-binding protein